MKKIKSKKEKRRVRIHRKVRMGVSGTKSAPRLCVFRSSRYIYAQLVDDEKGITLASASDLSSKKKSRNERAKEVGDKIASLAKAKGINQAVFDRGGFAYTGRVKALADAAREGGLKF